MKRIIHISDVHFSRENQQKAIDSLKKAIEVGQDINVDAWVFAGDLFDRAVQNTASSGLPDLISVLKEMLDVAPIISVEGTKTHDIAGCYYIFQDIEAANDFYNIDPRTPVVVNGILFFGIPEPGKEWFLAGNEAMGADEAREKIETGMREILLGFAAKRKEFPDIPAVLIGHLNVAGASMSNGQTVMQREIKVGRDDLSMVGADYIALGHIHLRQQIGDLPAYYGGSAFPVTWSETDQKGCIIASFEGGELADVEFINYPHPPRKKIVTDWTGAEEAENEDPDGCQVWQVYRVARERQHEIDPDAILEKMYQWGALPGSRVTVEVIPTETVRAGEIQEAKSLPDKFAIYAENSGDKLTKSIIEKAETLEAEAREEGRISEGAHIRIDSLSLRGAIGPWKGLNKDEIYLDFNSYSPGLIALCGPNGSSKTTLIENMQPFPTMLTRSGKLQDHFRLRDSWRDLHFTDCRTGSTYRAYIEIDGQNASGSCSYHLYRDGQPIVNGRKTDYEEKITELFGSLALYLRSAFVAQKANKQNPDLAAATQGEKKTLFRELAGLEYLQLYADTAKERAKALESETERAKGQLEALDPTIAKLKALRDTDTELLHAVAAKTRELNNLEAQDAELKNKAAELKERVDRNRHIDAERKQLRSTTSNNTQRIEAINTEREEYTVAVTRQGAAEYKLNEYEQLQEKIRGLESDRNNFTERRNAELENYAAAREVVEAQDKELAQNCEKVRASIAQKREEKAQKVAKIDYLDDLLTQPLDTTCPTCKQELPPETARRLKSEREKTELTLKALQEAVLEIDQDINDLDKALNELIIQRKRLPWPEAPKDEPYNDTMLVSLQAQATEYNPEHLREIIEKAKAASARIQTLEAEKSSLLKQNAEIDARLADLDEIFDESADAEYQQIVDRLEELRTEYGLIGRERAAKQAELKGVEQRIAELETEIAELHELQDATEAKIKDAGEWRYLERACGPNGIQALELDALAPSIAEVANRLLSTAYNSRFSIEFRTTRIAGTGSKTKQVEDFEIIIHDSEDGSEQALDTLSGGEAVWVKKAIYDSFGIIRARNTGTQFLTVFLDESDGALDPEAKAHYFRMIEAAHQEAGRHHTILITHSEDIQEMIGQRIVMNELSEVKREAVA